MYNCQSHGNLWTFLYKSLQNAFTLGSLLNIDTFCYWRTLSYKNDEGTEAWLDSLRVGDGFDETRSVLLYIVVDQATVNHNLYILLNQNLFFPKFVCVCVRINYNMRKSE